MNKKLLKEMTQQKGEPCVSIITSSALKSFSDKEKIMLKLKNAVSDTRKQLEEKYDNLLSNKLIQSIQSLIHEVNLDQHQSGIGIFVSPEYARLVYFQFPVKNRVMINDRFDVKDILENLNKLSAYHVLLLSKGHTRLFNGSGPVLEEIADEHFPQEYEDDFQVERSHPGKFYSGEESKVNQVRLESYLRKVDDALNGHVNQGPLIVMGVQNFLSDFKRISKHAKLIEGEVTGSYDKHSLHEIATLVWPVIEAYQQQYKQRIIESAKESIYKKRAVSGIQEVWDIVQQGIGDHLIVEKDYACKAYHEKHHDEIILEGGAADNLNEVPDAVESVIDHMLAQHDTQVHIVDNDTLKEFGRIILTTKY